ncbi:unnamed protein product, partial [Prorocentrum cordatum]
GGGAAGREDQRRQLALHAGSAAAPVLVEAPRAAGRRPAAAAPDRTRLAGRPSSSPPAAALGGCAGWPDAAPVTASLRAALPGSARGQRGCSPPGGRSWEPDPAPGCRPAGPDASVSCLEHHLVCPAVSKHWVNCACPRRKKFSVGRPRRFPPPPPLAAPPLLPRPPLLPPSPPLSGCWDGPPRVAARARCGLGMLLDTGRTGGKDWQ